MARSAMRCGISPAAARRPTRLCRAGTVPSIASIFDPTGSSFASRLSLRWTIAQFRGRSVQGTPISRLSNRRWIIAHRGLRIDGTKITIVSGTEPQLVVFCEILGAHVQPVDADL